MKRYDNIDNFFQASSELVEAEINFDWSLALNRSNELSKFHRLSVINFGKDSKITNLKGIEKITNLKTVRAIGQHRLKDISSLEKLPFLHELKITAAWQLDLKSFEHMTNLKKLLIDGPTKGYRYLNKLINLEYLAMYNMKLKNLNNISDLRKLKILEARGIPLSSLEGIPKDAPLENLNFSQTKVSSLVPLESLREIRVLWLCKCRKLVDITSLAKLKKLKEVYLNEIPNEIDLSPLAECPNLEVLFFYDTKVLDDSFKVFKKLKKLRRCEFTLSQQNINYSVNEIQSFLPQCKFRIVLHHGRIFKSDYKDFCN